MHPGTTGYARRVRDTPPSSAHDPLRTAKIELRHYRYFLAVAEELHFGRAARRLHIAQPPLSQQIKMLEEELGVRLFTRNTHHVSLTEPGRVFLKEARRVLADVERSIRLARQTAEGTAGRLAIGFVSLVDGGVISRVKSVLSVEYPELDLRFLPLDTVAQVAALREGQIQAGILAAPMEEEDLSVEKIFRSPLVVALPEMHPLASRPALRLADLSGEPLVSFSAQFNPWIHRHFADSCRRAGFVPNIAQESASPISVVGFVASNAGLGILPVWVKLDRKGVVYRPLHPDDFQVHVAIACLKGPDSPLLRHLGNVLQMELTQVTAAETPIG